ncbi:MAG: hypothetical protein KKB50_11425 [Planctomycetes bacterium]|nr:hypothetical protein [Planctomycetota bacterium]
MNERPQPDRQPRPPISGCDLPFMSIVSGLLFLYVGFGLGLEGISGNALYDGSVTAFVWGARVVGIGLLAVAALSYLGLPQVCVLDLLMAALAALGCLAVGVIWLAFGDMQGALLILFGLFNASAMRYAWRRWQAMRHSAPDFEEEQAP